VAAGVVATVLVVLPCASGISSATTWAVHLVAGAHGEAIAQGLPAAPTSPVANCVSASTKTIKVSWSAVPLATTYTIYRSKTSAANGYAVTASGVAGTSWTSGVLGTGNYWFEVAVVIGNNWLGSSSSATGETTIQNGATKCVQP
jgi:hypothetical protein